MVEKLPLATLPVHLAVHMKIWTGCLLGSAATPSQVPWATLFARLAVRMKIWTGHLKVSADMP